MTSNGFTLTSFLSTLLTSIRFGDILREIQFHILNPEENPGSAVIVKDWILTSAEAVYIEEIWILMEKESGLHMTAYNLHPAQLEGGRIRALAPFFESRVPALWGLFQKLLVVESKMQVRRWAKPAPPSTETRSGRNKADDGDHVSAGRQSKGNSSERQFSLLKIKGVVIISLIVNNCNGHCNALQVQNSFYLAASNASKSVRGWAAHTGLAVSPSSIENIRTSLIKNQKILNKSLGRTRIVNLAYDNCDFKFGVGQPMDLKDRTFESITTGLFFMPPKEVLPEHLEYAETIWNTHPNNPNFINVPAAITFADIVPTAAAVFKLMKHCQWHIKSVLIEEYFPELHPHLIDPPSTFQLPPHRTTYSTAEAVYAKASTIDGNVEAIMSLLEQSGIMEERVSDHLLLVLQTRSWWHGGWKEPGGV
ncbi:uncharacterized protein EI90DRAFT_3116378 [Cantharellus anzutake]|uniref:uncharacterized protein n=1 Tax=Cantharellus anzutake TaxID=1750568 RepID=UPI0019041C64|nr:uncharacterized protein EI90DRAFT_3116378 [Cantharellus anzutake]KAF8341236.1 hypothetical protein EI90DRAFT_3116378 [Cantharellus anzutake]